VLAAVRYEICQLSCKRTPVSVYEVQSVGFSNAICGTLSRIDERCEGRLFCWNAVEFDVLGSLMPLVYEH
jgi:hypothetical protein